MKLIGYVRVSTIEQAQKGLGLELQRTALIEWARAQKHKLIAIHEDAGESGSNGLEHRRGLTGCLSALRTGEAEGLVVLRLDRFARDVILQESLLREFAGLGARVFSTMGGEDAFLEDDPKDPSRRLIRTIIGAVADYDRALVRLRLEAGREAARADPERFSGHGSPLYGWRSERGRLVEDPNEQRVIALIRGYRRAGGTLASIANELNAAGVKPRRGTAWYPQTVKRIVERESVAAEKKRRARKAP